MTKRRAITEISYTLLHKLLYLPEDIEIVGTEPSDLHSFQREGLLRIKLSGGNLPIIAEGETIPVVVGRIEPAKRMLWVFDK